MIGQGMSTAGKAPAVDHVQVVALYDAATGRIRHLHMITTLAGGARHAEAEAIAQARAQAARRYPDADTLAVATSNAPEHGLRPHTIDPATKTFVPQERPSASRVEPSPASG